jgi:hypothetical protein
MLKNTSVPLFSLSERLRRIFISGGFLCHKVHPGASQHVQVFSPCPDIFVSILAGNKAFSRPQIRKK